MQCGLVYIYIYMCVCVCVCVCVCTFVWAPYSYKWSLSKSKNENINKKLLYPYSTWTDFNDSYHRYSNICVEISILNLEVSGISKIWDICGEYE